MCLLRIKNTKVGETTRITAYIMQAETPVRLLKKDKQMTAVGAGPFASQLSTCAIYCSRLETAVIPLTRDNS